MHCININCLGRSRMYYFVVLPFPWDFTQSLICWTISAHPKQWHLLPWAGPLCPIRSSSGPRGSSAMPHASPWPPDSPAFGTESCFASFTDAIPYNKCSNSSRSEEHKDLDYFTYWPGSKLWNEWVFIYLPQPEAFCKTGWQVSWGTKMLCALGWQLSPCLAHLSAQLGFPLRFSICGFFVQGFVPCQGFTYRFLWFRSCFLEDPAASVAPQWRRGLGAG